MERTPEESRLGRVEQDTAGLDKEIARLDSEIVQARSEDAAYTGGLIKGLVGARLAILGQTRAMLDQIKQAETHKESIAYTVDGKPFIPPPDSAQLAKFVDQELATLRAKIALHEATASPSAGGLLGVIAASTLATMRQTEAMLDQKRLSLLYSLPQYVGFDDRMDHRTTQDGNSPLPTNRATPTDDARLQHSESIFKIQIETRTMESNEVWTKMAWKLTVQNSSDVPRLLDATINFLDRDGFVVETDHAYALRSPPGSGTFTGFRLIGAQLIGKVVNVQVEVVARN